MDCDLNTNRVLGHDPCLHIRTRLVSKGHDSCLQIRTRLVSKGHDPCPQRAVQMRTIIGGGNGGTNLGHLFQFAADQVSDPGALLSLKMPEGQNKDLSYQKKVFRLKTALRLADPSLMDFLRLHASEVLAVSDQNEGSQVSFGRCWFEIQVRNILVRKASSEDAAILEVVRSPANFGAEQCGQDWNTNIHATSPPPHQQHQTQKWGVWATSNNTKN
ncbi:hypothetical protein LXL04_039065 [Taraxacum kok-saghyz]